MQVLNFVGDTALFLRFAVPGSPSPAPARTTPSGGTGGTGGSSGIVVTWQAVVVVATILGLLAALQQLIKAFSDRKLRAAEQRVVEIAASQLDAEKLQRAAEDARRDAQDLERVKLALLDEVEQRIPRQARRVYLDSRLQQLANNIASQIEEYDSLHREAKQLESDTDPLSEQLRASVTAGIDPIGTARRRAERNIIVLLVVLIILSLTPIDPSNAIYEYFATAYFADRAGIATTTVVLLLGASVCAVLWRVILTTRHRWNFIGRRLNGINRLAVAGIAVVLACLFFATGSYLSLRASRAVNSEYSCSYGIDPGPSDCQFTDRSDEIDAARTTGAWALQLGTVSAGLSFIVIGGSLATRLKGVQAARRRAGSMAQS